ncbi:MAG: hypothetical protein OEU36_23780 [Gammaproteobacteria bacterium]|nr:hypothetical protein [Gammaproteobacteria bacterium]
MSDNQVFIPNIKDFRPFIPCGKDGQEMSINFYQDLAFKLLWRADNREVCEIDTGFGHRFILLDKYNKHFADNLMLHIWVDSVDDWYEYLKPKKLDRKYSGVKVTEPDVLPWGWRILYIWDPAGVLLHIAEPHTEKNKEFFNKATWLD